MCFLIDRYPLSNDVKELYQQDDDEELVVVWQETLVSADLLVRGQGLLAHDFWIGVYRKRSCSRGRSRIGLTHHQCREPILALPVEACQLQQALRRTAAQTVAPVKVL